MPADPFAVLELSHAATDAEIKAAYRRLVALYHPDNNPGFQALATAKVSELNEAYAQVRNGWRPPIGGAGAGGSGSRAGGGSGAGGARTSNFVRKSRSRSRSGGAPPWTPPPPVRHDNPPRVWDPPTPPPRAKGPQAPARPPGPQPPPARYPPPPPPRKGAWEGGGAAAGDPARRSALVAELVAVGFFAGAVDAERGHPILDALLPLLPPAARLRSCATYSVLDASGDLPSTEQHHHFHHAVPSLAVGGFGARTEAIARLEPARFVACSEDQLIWTVSVYAPGDGILLQEDVTVHAAPLTAVAGLDRHADAVDITLDGDLRLSFHLPKPQAAALAAALVRAT